VSTASNECENIHRNARMTHQRGADNAGRDKFVMAKNIKKRRFFELFVSRQFSPPSTILNS
jgi:hypothetical protein